VALGVIGYEGVRVSGEGNRLAYQRILRLEGSARAPEARAGADVLHDFDRHEVTAAVAAYGAMLLYRRERFRRWLSAPDMKLLQRSAACPGISSTHDDLFGAHTNMLFSLFTLQDNRLVC
jgi:hypothetical protein